MEQKLLTFFAGLFLAANETLFIFTVYRFHQAAQQLIQAELRWSAQKNQAFLAVDRNKLPGGFKIRSELDRL